ncbi:hypothetical protein OSL57_25525, partial [Escherichia coli]|nr:hypothetical protein [Escherichia coli]
GFLLMVSFVMLCPIIVAVISARKNKTVSLSVTCQLLCLFRGGWLTVVNRNTKFEQPFFLYSIRRKKTFFTGISGYKQKNPFIS